MSQLPQEPKGAVGGITGDPFLDFERGGVLARRDAVAYPFDRLDYTVELRLEGQCGDAYLRVVHVLGGGLFHLILEHVVGGQVQRDAC